MSTAPVFHVQLTALCVRVASSCPGVGVGDWCGEGGDTPEGFQIKQPEKKLHELPSACVIPCGHCVGCGPLGLRAHLGL